MSWKNQRRANASKSILLRTREDEVRSARPFHRRSMERSFFPGDVSAPRRTELSRQALLPFFLFDHFFCKIVQRKTQKKEWTVLVLWRRRAGAPSAAIDASAKCLLPTGSAASKSALLAFLNFGFVWEMKDFVTGDVRQSSELYFEQLLRILHSPVPIRFSRNATAQGVNSAKRAPASMKKIDLWAPTFSIFVGIDFYVVIFLPNSLRIFSSSFQWLQTVATELKILTFSKKVASNKVDRTW